ncbi:hypothetical protein HU200_065774 [Digitaria exilis]|uniref:DUF1618 domain-containing protein n=1 Tax=Digitaria exilis TaxID=1010633 RepID=A0A835DX70_9POAL|nr:hypothetical protein HU200_065774 [Digitaria exilis]
MVTDVISDPPAATRSPRWVLLEPYVNNNVSEPSIPDAKTTAASCTSTGQSFSVSFAPAAPPATSTYCCEWIGGSPGDDNDDDPDEEPNLTGDDESKNLHIVAVHDDCALIQMTPPESRRRPDAMSLAAPRMLLFDMEDDDETSPNKLLYVPLPVPLPEEHRRKTDRPYLPYRRNLGAAGLNAVRFVSIEPRCCCGGYGKTSCERSRFAFNDGVLDCDELWQLPNYGCLPHVSLEYPIVSADNPDVICFMLCEDHYLIDGADETVWLLEIDTKRKALLSVVRHGTSGYYIDSRVPVKLCW